MGKLIVIEGTDGSGKSTQFRLLSEHLQTDNIAFKHLVFPRYDQESSALIRMYLGGQFGSKPTDVNAYAASAFYAVDRYASYNTGIGAKIRAGETTLEELAAYAENMGAPELPGSGRQEYLESIVNNILFCG